VALRAHLAEATKGDTSSEVNAGVGVLLQVNTSMAGDDEESYQLHVGGSGVELRAPALAGLFYGVQTLKQLIPLDEGGSHEVAALTIRDTPRFRWRGLHLDVSRHFFSAAQVKQLLDTMATFKFNRFHWHLTDDQGWRLPVQSYPKLTQIGAQGSDGVSKAYTADEIRDVVAYAAARHIEVMPEVDIPGHATAAIAAYPELGNVDVPGWEPPSRPERTYGVKEFTMSPSNATLSFLEAVLTQVVDLFPGSLVHIGGDEVPTAQWGKSKLALAVQQREGLSNVQMFFNKWVSAILQGKNRTAVAWDEARKVGGLPGEAIIMAWRSAGELRKSVHERRRAINADSSCLYFDHYQGPKEAEPQAFSASQSTLRQVYAYDPMPGGLTEEEQREVLGGQGQLWSEYFPTWEHTEYMAHPRSLALAERLWTPLAQIEGFDDFKGRLWKRLADLDRLGVNYRRLYD
jgi:hexosaminidase